MSRLLAVAVLFTWGVSSSASGQGSAPDTVTMDFDGVELHQAIQFLLRDRNVNLVTGEELEEKVTLKLSNVEWKRALRSILMSHGYTYFEEDGIIRVLRADASKPDAVQPRLPLIIRLQHVTPEVAQRALEPLLSPLGKIVIIDRDSKIGGTLSVVDTPSSLEHIDRVARVVDTPPEETSEGRIVRHSDGTIDIELVDFPLSELDSLLRRDLDLNVYMQGSIPGKRTVNLQNVEWQNALRLLLGEQNYGFREDGNVILIAESSRFAEERTTQQFKLKYLDAIDLLQYVKELLSDGDKVSVFSPSPRARFTFGSKVSEPRGLQKDGETTRRSRILAVTARPDILAMVADRIREVDVQPPQIEIEVKIVQIILDDSTQMGVDWNMVLSFVGSARPTNLPFGPHGGRFFPGNFPDPPTGFIFGQVRGDELTAILRVIQETNETEIISEPNISTLDNVEARILVGTRFPVTSETLDPQTSVRTVTLDYYEDIGIQLNVVPSVSEGNRIHMIIHPAVSSVGELVEERFPIINTREADTQLLMRSGETAIIGGLLERTESERVRGIPILDKLPLFGKYLFSYRETQQVKTELVIFVTPRIVLERDQYTDSLRVSPDRLDGLLGIRARLDSVRER